ncbi:MULTISPECIES: hypothetical protein [unclassified Polynucleobacter]|uniref:hypothetical protein n=1 Tax=unclassified Polynucleobacter TaxID=2640945 RepID=UPI0011606515|nr:MULTISPECIES: hypothetical protein [unclassified Polynucleobacter]
MLQPRNHLPKFVYHNKAGHLPYINFRLMRCAIAITFVLMGGIHHANAIELLCSSSENLSALNKDEFSVALVKDAHISLGDLPQLFSASYENDGSETIRVCLFPPESPSTKSLLSSLGVSRTSFKSLLANRDSMKDSREIKLVSSESEMFQCVEGAYPSIGYTARAINSRNDLGCY